MSNRLGEWSRRAIWVLAAGCAGIAVFWGVPRAQAFHGHDGDGESCVPVYGTFTSEPVPPSECSSPVGFCTHGTLTGLLGGTYDFTMSESTPAPVPGILFYSGQSLIHTRGGLLITATDTGTIDVAPDRWGNFVSLITITDGTGFFEGARGQLALRGKLDLVTGNVDGNFHATICLPH